MLPNLVDAPQLALMTEFAEGIDHVALAVIDLEEAIQFYTKIVGFELKEKRATQGQKSGMISAVLSGGPFTIVLVQGTSETSQVSRFINAYGPGLQHMAIRVTNIEYVVTELKARGLQFSTTIIRSPGLLQAFTVRDEKTRMMIEFVERSDTVDGFTDQNVDSLFQQLEASDSF